MTRVANKWISEWLGGLGQFALLCRETIASLFTFKVAWRDLLYQMYFIGVKSQSVVLITGAFTGMVLAAQTYFQFHKVKMDTATLAVVGVSMDEDGWDAVKPYVEQKKMNYQVVLGNDQVSQLFGSIESLPTTIVIDREGRIASMHIGLVSKSTYQKEIEKLLEAPRDVPKTGAVRAAGSEFAWLRSN